MLLKVGKFGLLQLVFCGLIGCALSHAQPQAKDQVETQSKIISLSVDGQDYVLQAGHPSLLGWRMPSQLLQYAINNTESLKAELGMRLFFDTQLSQDGSISCASCHNPALGWSDGLPLAVGFQGKILTRATPTIINVGLNPVQNWDGRNQSLEEQALEPVLDQNEMHMNLGLLMQRLSASEYYQSAFEQVFPNSGLSEVTIAKAIASFERTVVSTDAPFDRWIQGDATAMTAEQVYGFQLFLDPQKGDCAACHSGPNFTDNSFHNIGLASYQQSQPDMGRFAKLPLNSMKGAFKTPTLRNIAETAPYFHDGSATDLQAAIRHYISIDPNAPDLSKNIKPVKLSQTEVDALLAFMQALSGKVSFGSKVHSTAESISIK